MQSPVPEIVKTITKKKKKKKRERERERERERLKEIRFRVTIFKTTEMHK